MKYVIAQDYVFSLRQLTASLMQALVAAENAQAILDAIPEMAGRVVLPEAYVAATQVRIAALTAAIAVLHNRNLEAEP